MSLATLAQKGYRTRYNWGAGKKDLFQTVCEIRDLARSVVIKDRTSLRSAWFKAVYESGLLGQGDEWFERTARYANLRNQTKRKAQGSSPLRKELTRFIAQNNVRGSSHLDEVSDDERRRVQVNSALRAAVEIGNFEEGARIAEGSVGTWIARPTLNKLIDGLVRVGDGARARSMVNGLRRSGFNPCTITLNSLLRTNLPASTSEMALDSLSSMSREFGVIPDCVSYNTFITKFANEGNFCEARKLVSAMEQQGIRPSTATYNVLVSRLIKKGRFDEARSIWSEMKRLDVKPDAHSFTILLDYRNSVGDTEAVMNLFDVMLENKVPIDSRAMIPVLSASSTPETMINVVRKARLHGARKIDDALNFVADKLNAEGDYRVAVLFLCELDKGAYLVDEDRITAILNTLNVSVDRSQVTELISFLEEKGLHRIDGRANEAVVRAGLARFGSTQALAEFAKEERLLRSTGGNLVNQ